MTMTMSDDVGGEAEMTFKGLDPKMLEDFEVETIGEAPYKMTAVKGDDGKWRVEIRTRDGSVYSELVENAKTDTPNTEKGANTLIQQMKKYILSYNREPEPELNDGEKRCCLCEKMFVGWGNNPKPLPFARIAKGDAFTSYRCCDDCNQHLVLPVRMRLSLEGEMLSGVNDVRKILISKVGENREIFHVLQRHLTIVPYYTNSVNGRTFVYDERKFHLPTQIRQITEKVVQSKAQKEQRKAKKEAEKAKEEQRKIKEAQRQEEEAERRRIENDMIAKRREESARLEAEYNAAKQREFEERLKALERREAEKREEEKREKEQKAKEAEERKAKKEAEKAEKQKQFQSKRK